jgi:Zn-finger nucleic acid-binding protein
MNCPKCPGILSHSTTRAGAAYDWCSLCKGIWILATSIPKIFPLDKMADSEKWPQLQRLLPNKFSCPSCQENLKTGQVKNSQMEIDICDPCQGYFFDDKEINTLLTLLQQQDLPAAPAPTISFENMVKLEVSCPVCKDENLWSVRNKESNFKACLRCEGILTTVEAVQKIVARSIFSPTMFTFRSERGSIACCRFCHEEQSPSNTDCQKCGRPLVKLACPSCQGRMSEYSLKNIIIDRCQMCNSLWLDQGELQQIMVAMPDVRKQFEEGQRGSELLKLEVKVGLATQELGLDITYRKVIDRFWGIGSIFFYD